jgi:hypothetical protein
LPGAREGPWILNDYRASISLGLLKDGVENIGTTDPLLIDNARRSLTNLARLVGLRIGNATSRQLASGQSWVHHAWSGQAVAAVRYLPGGVPAYAIGYWFPPAGNGPVANDTNTVLRGAKNPVLAHLFLNFMLERANVMHNIAATGYTPAAHVGDAIEACGCWRPAAKPGPGGCAVDLLRSWAAGVRAAGGCRQAVAASMARSHSRSQAPSGSLLSPPVMHDSLVMIHASLDHDFSDLYV